MVSALDCGSSGLGSSSGRGHCCVGAGSQPLNGLTSHPGKSRYTPGRFMLQKPG